MRRLITLTLILMGLTAAMAQDRCGTMQTEAMTNALQENKKLWPELIQRSSTPVFIPITFHLIADNGGNGRFSEEEVLKAVCLLNDRFQDNGTDMFFYVKEFNEINNDLMFDNPIAASGLIRNNTRNDAMNIFVVNSISSPNPNSTGTTLGFYSGFGDYIVIRKQNVGDPSYTLEHEIGHFFTLRHTHYGWEDTPYSPQIHGEKISFFTISGSSQVPPGAVIEVEFEDRTNCETAGDLLCDTPPNYAFGFACNCCVMPWVVLDPRNDTIVPQMENIMSYSSGCDERVFTGDQVMAMTASYESSSRDYLRTDVTETEFRPVDQEVVLTFPENASTVEVYNDIVFEWEPVPNAEYYIVNVNTRMFRTSETSLRVTDLNPNAVFQTWNVRAYGRFGGGCSGATDFFFATGNTSSVNNIDHVADVNIFPNPVSSNSQLHITFSSDKAAPAQISLHSVTGQTVYHNEVNIVSGLNNLSIDPIVESGIYILEMKSEKGTLIETIIVE